MADVRFTCSALRCGRGLIARPTLSADLGGSSRIGLPFSSLSSSESLSLRRVPARAGGDGSRLAFAASMSADLGRYLGNAEVVSELRGRNVDERVTPRFALITLGEDDCSSEDVVPLALGSPESRRELFAEIVFVSGDAAFSLLPAAGLSTGDGAGTRLRRLEMVLSLTFFAFSFSAADSLLSLCMTSARAFPMDEKLRALMCALVLGRVRWGTPASVAGSVGMVARV